MTFLIINSLVILILVYVITYKKGKTNIIHDTFSYRHVLFSKLDAHILGFEHMNEFYSQDFLSVLPTVSLKHRESIMYLRDICLKKEYFVFPKDQIGNSL